MLECAFLLRVYHVTEAVQYVIVTRCCLQYRDCWCDDKLCIASLRVRLESHILG